MTATVTAPAPPATTSNASPQDQQDLRHLLATQGYAIVPSILTSDELFTLRAAASTATTRARLGSWPHIRTLPKQFPPWPSSPPAAGIWGVQHLLHPSLPESATFATSYFHPRILSAVSSILGLDTSSSAGDVELVMELYNLLVTPDADFSLRWHRDDIPPSCTADEERALLAAQQPITHAQWNLALHDDASLLVVPGSQARARTAAERSADPYADGLAGMVSVAVRAGDAVFYDNNILHTGRYSAGKARATLHGSMGLREGSKGRARNVLQHGVGEWVGACDFGGLEGTWEGRRLGEVAEGMVANLVGMGSGEGVGYSLGGLE